MAFEARIAAKQQHKNRCRVVRPNRAKHFQVCPSPSSGASNDTDFVMGRRTTSLLLMRTGCKSMRLLPGGLTWSESARSRCCRSFGLARCGLQAGSRGAACPASTHQRAVHPRGGHRRDTGQPVCVKVRYRVRRAHGCATGPAEPAPPPEHTRHFKPAIRAL